MAAIQSIVDRVAFVTKDPTFTRHTLAEILLWTQDAIDQVASLHPRAAAIPVTLTLAEGSRQDLRAIDPNRVWMRIYEITCNVVSNKPVGGTVRQIMRSSLDNAVRNWRATAPAAEVKEYAIDERDPFSFDVYPPVVAGTKVLALAAVKPAPFEDEDSMFPLAPGYDIPVVDYVLFRLFSKDANDPTYAGRASGHLQAFNLAMGVETKDAAP